MKHAFVVLLLAACGADPMTSADDVGADTLPDAGPDLPAPECRNPADCPQFSTCRAGECVETSCQADGECGQGNRCEDRRCVEVGDAACDTADDCGFRWRCSEGGRCVFGECDAHADCPAGQWCKENVCEASRGLVGSVELRRTMLPPLTDHRAGAFEFLYGWGGALLDYDGDGDLDVFLGTLAPESDNSPACLYRNESTPGGLVFEATSACGALGEPRFGSAIDVDADGTHELITAGRRTLELVRFGAEIERTDLLALVPDDDPRSACDAGSAVVVDLDLDGHLDLLVGCARTRTDPTSDDGYPNLALRWNPTTSAFELLGDALPGVDTPALLADPGYTLALGVLDVDRDGLPDILIANDTFTSRDESANFLPPGSALFRCPPDDLLCSFEPHAFDSGDRAWGSFMGFGAIEVDGLGEHIYISDFGPNRLLQFVDRRPRDRAPDQGAEAATAGGHLLFGWAVMVDDFDHNGLDDILVTNGNPERAEPDEFAVQQDMVLFQTADGRFTPRGTEVGLSPPTSEDSLDTEHVYSSRGGVRVDLDHDGYLEVLHTGLTGFAKLHVEQPTADNAPRCTLRPVTTVVPAMGHSVGVRGESEDTFHYRDVQGQIRWGASPWVVTRHRRGTVRFPSGAQVEYECPDTGVLDVIEPDWIQVTFTDREATIAAEGAWFTGNSVEIVVVSDGVSTTIAPGPRGPDGWTVPAEGDDVRVMVGFDSVWVPRWFR